MTGQIPPYGRDFRREGLPWSPELANRRYVLKIDCTWWIRSDHTSETWWIFWNDLRITSADTFGEAMRLLLTGIENGYYFADTRARRLGQLRPVGDVSNAGGR